MNESIYIYIYLFIYTYIYIYVFCAWYFFWGRHDLRLLRVGVSLGLLPAADVWLKALAVVTLHPHGPNPQGLGPTTHICFGMFPLKLAALSRDYSTPYYYFHNLRERPNTYSTVLGLRVWGLNMSPLQERSGAQGLFLFVGASYVLSNFKRSRWPIVEPFPPPPPPQESLNPEP